MKRTYFCILLLMAIILCGCSKPLSVKLQPRQITILTNPQGAKVYQINALQNCPIFTIDGTNAPKPEPQKTFLGTTPIQSQSVMVVSGIKGKGSPKTVYSLASKINMVEVEIIKEGYKPYRGLLATDPKEVKEHSISLEKQE